MDRNACHVVVALGCLLYGYQSGEIVTLAPEIFDQHNIWRVKRRLMQQLHGRFQRTHIFDEYHTLHTRAPAAHERQAVQASLALFTPWGTPHLTPPAPEGSILETHFDGASDQSDWTRIHALIDPECAGLPRLIREYNATFPRGSAACLADPDHMLAIPCFAP